MLNGRFVAPTKLRKTADRPMQVGGVLTLVMLNNSPVCVVAEQEDVHSVVASLETQTRVPASQFTTIQIPLAVKS